MNAKSVISALVAVATLIVFGTLWLANCGGPRPEVTSVQLREPEQPGDPFVVEVEVRARGRGEGQAEVDIELEGGDGQRYVASERVTLERGKPVAIAVEFAVPDGEYEASAHVRYPP
jgi:hypothetical protein